MDVRSRGFDPERLPELFQSMGGVEPEILYLDCAGGELIRRYDETRRRHPLAPDRPAEDGIARERRLTAPLKKRRRQPHRHHRPQRPPSCATSCGFATAAIRTSRC